MIVPVFIFDELTDLMQFPNSSFNGRANIHGMTQYMLLRLRGATGSAWIDDSRYLRVVSGAWSYLVIYLVFC